MQIYFSCNSTEVRELTLRKIWGCSVYFLILGLLNFMPLKITFNCSSSVSFSVTLLSQHVPKDFGRERLNQFGKNTNISECVHTSHLSSVGGIFYCPLTHHSNVLIRLLKKNNLRNNYLKKIMLLLPQKAHLLPYILFTCVS